MCFHSVPFIVLNSIYWYSWSLVQLLFSLHYNSHPSIHPFILFHLSNLGGLELIPAAIRREAGLHQCFWSGFISLVTMQLLKKSLKFSPAIEVNCCKVSKAIAVHKSTETLKGWEIKSPSSSASWSVWHSRGGEKARAVSLRNTSAAQLMRDRTCALLWLITVTHTGKKRYLATRAVDALRIYFSIYVKQLEHFLSNFHQSTIWLKGQGKCCC